jgi:nitroreductase
MDRTGTASTHKRELVRYATLAASGHNTQPWRFTIAEDAITITPDYTRRVPVIDPHDRELWISLGYVAPLPRSPRRPVEQVLA